MNTSAINSELQPQVGDSVKNNQLTAKTHYRRRDTFFKIHDQAVEPCIQTFDPNSIMGTTQTAFGSEGNQVQGILDPEKQDTENIEPGKEIEQQEFPDKEEDDEINPNSDVPEEGNEIAEDEGSIIKEPTRELDDSYRPGHADRENIPPIKKEFP